MKKYTSHSKVEKLKRTSIRNPAFLSEKEGETRQILAKNDLKKNDPKDEGQSTAILESIRTLTAGPLDRRGKKKEGVSRPKGLTLGIKLALINSVVVASLVFITGLSIYFPTLSTFMEQVDKKGASLVKSLVYIGKEYKRVYNEAFIKWQNEENKATTEGQKLEIINKSKEEYSQIQEKFSGYLRSLVFYRQDNAIIRSDEILKIVIQNTDKSGSPPSIFTEEGIDLRGTSRTYTEEINDVKYPTNITIIEGNAMSLDGKSRDTIGIRAYSMKVEDKMEAVVLLSETGINRVKQRLLVIIFIATFISIIIGIVVSSILANHVTTPIRKLMKDIEIVATGDLDHKTVPTSKDEIGILAYTFNNLTRNLKLAHETELDHKAVELEDKARKHELDIATEIQANLLPKKIPKIEGYEIDAFYSPSKEVGGDYYDFIEIDKDHLGLIVADVSGKGVPGSMVMTMTRSLIRMEAYRNLSPSDTFIKVNKIIAQDIKLGMFVTAFYIILTIKTGEILVASAGHNPAILWRKDIRKHKLLKPKGIALGFDKGEIFDNTIQQGKIQLKEGDRIILYTDGVPEAMNEENQEFGDERFYNLVGREGDKDSNQFVNILVTALDQWRGNGPQSDDITILTLRRVVSS